MIIHHSYRRHLNTVLFRSNCSAQTIADNVGTQKYWLFERYHLLQDLIIGSHQIIKWRNNWLPLHKERSICTNRIENPQDWNFQVPLAHSLDGAYKRGWQTRKTRMDEFQGFTKWWPKIVWGHDLVFAVFIKIAHLKYEPGWLSFLRSKSETEIMIRLEFLLWSFHHKLSPSFVFYWKLPPKMSDSFVRNNYSIKKRCKRCLCFRCHLFHVQM